MALSTAALAAPLRPVSPGMRPFSMRKSMLSSAAVVHASRHKRVTWCASGRALQVDGSTHLFAVRHRELQRFGVMVGVDEVEDGALHVFPLRRQQVGGVD